MRTFTICYWESGQYNYHEIKAESRRDAGDIGIQWLAKNQPGKTAQTAIPAAPTEYRATEEEKSMVYGVCNESRTKTDGPSEEECGRVQDTTHTEFLCESADQLPETKCWVEDMPASAYSETGARIW